MAPRRIHELERGELRRAVLVVVARGIAITAVLLTLYYVAPAKNASDALAVADLTFGLVVFVGVLVWQVRRILTADLPELRMIEAIATVLPCFLIAFALAYLSLSHSDTKAFSEPLTHTSALYFVVVTFGTVGFGDIAPSARLGSARRFRVRRRLGAVCASPQTPSSAWSRPERMALVNAW